MIPIPFASSSPAAAGGIRQTGIYYIAPIVLDGATLFTIAAPADQSGVQSALLDRMTTIESSLQEITAPVALGGQTMTAYDPSTLQVEVGTEHGQTIVEAVDRRHRTPNALVTVTTVDAQYHGTTIAALAEQWRDALQPALQHALAVRQPGTIKRSVQLVEWVAGGLAILTVIGGFGIAALRRRSTRLRKTAEERARKLDAEQVHGPQGGTQPHEQRRRFLALAMRSADPAERAKGAGALAGLIGWALGLLWFASLVWALSLFPQTTPVSQSLSRAAIGVVATAIVAAILNRLGDVAISRIAAAWREREQERITSEQHARKLLRVPTVAGALSGFKSFVLLFLAALTILSQVGVPVGSVVTIGGLVAVAVSLAAQNFVRDFLNGFMVLLEDQYVVGDFVTINGMTGLVEELTLRIVQIRDGQGSLVTIPHSAVTTVTNYSRDWSRVDYVISIAPDADPEKAIAVVRGTIEEIANDPEWADAALTPVEWIGIGAFSHDWTLIRASIKTAPLRQFQFRRVLNARVRAALAAAEIGLGPAVPADQIPLA